jgi:ferredoxin
MRVIVDLDVCEYHGQCEIAAPDIFQLKDEETLVWAEEPDESLRDDAIAAADVCPTQAIRIED